MVSINLWTFCPAVVRFEAQHSIQLCKWDLSFSHFRLNNTEIWAIFFVCLFCLFTFNTWSSLWLGCPDHTLGSTSGLQMIEGREGDRLLKRQAHKETMRAVKKPATAENMRKWISAGRTCWIRQNKTYFHTVFIDVSSTPTTSNVKVFGRKST